MAMAENLREEKRVLTNGIGINYKMLQELLNLCNLLGS